MDSPRIVLAEDEAIVGIEIKNSLQRLGFARTDLVATGEAVLDQMEEEQPDLILMDINLDGDLDGIEATNKILSDHDVPIVFVTAYSSDEVIDRIRNTEALGYVVKPISDSDLETILDTVFDEGNGRKLDRGTFFHKMLRKLDNLSLTSNATAPAVV